MFYLRWHVVCEIFNESQSFPQFYFVVAVQKDTQQGVGGTWVGDYLVEN